MLACLSTWSFGVWGCSMISNYEEERLLENSCLIRFIGSHRHWMNDRLTESPTDWLTDWLMTDGLIDWLTDWRSDCMTEGRQTDGLTVRRTPIDRILEWSTDGLTDWLLSYLLNYNVHSESTGLHVSKFLTKNVCLLPINTITIMTKKTSKKTLFSPLKPRGYRTYLIRLTFSEIRTSWKTQKKEKYILICLFYLFLTHNGFFLKKKKRNSINFYTVSCLKIACGRKYLLPFYIS